MIDSVQQHSRENEDGRLSRLHLAALICFFISSTFTVVVLLVMSRLTHPEVDLSRAVELYALPVSSFVPEPLERRLFTSGLLLFPIIAAISWSVMSRAVFRVEKLRTILIQQWGIGAVTLLVTGGTVAYGFTVDRFVFRDVNWYMVVIAFVVSTVCVLLLRTTTVFSRLHKLKWLDVSCDIAACLLVSFISLFSVYGINAVTDTPIYNYHFNSLFHAVVQVFLGKELLVDLTTLYGLFPHFIEPVFRLTGLSVLSFTVLMGVLTGVSYFMLYAGMKKLLRNTPMALLGLSAILYASYVYLRVQTTDPYFQYHPIRLFFPAVTFYMAVLYVKTPSRLLYVATFMVSSMGMLWNFDTGVISFFSWLLLLLFKEFCGKLTVRGVAGHILYGIVCSASVVAVFSCYLAVRYGTFPDFSLVFRYQKLFYIFGYMMLPMPLFHPWNSIILVYMAGIVYAIASRDTLEDSSLPTLVFFLSVLGVGLFSYYQGRSHDHCLTFVSYPAIVLLTVFTHNLLSRMNKGSGIVASVSAIAFLGMFYVSLFAFARVGAPFYNIMHGRLKATASDNITQVVKDAAFVSRITRPGEGVLILSNLSGIYHLVSETVCPINIPGTTEIFMVDDYKRINEYIRSSSLGKIIIDDNFSYESPLPLSNPYQEDLWVFLKSRCVLVAQSPQRNLSVYLVRQ